MTDQAEAVALEDEQYHGHVTMADGTHVALSADEARALWRAAENAKEKRATDMPDEAAALARMTDAFTRLKELGWREAIYCPKDGTPFEVIEAGSTGVFNCYYEGEWPRGAWLIYDGGDLWPAYPILFRPMPVPPAPPEAISDQPGGAG